MSTTTDDQADKPNEPPLEGGFGLPHRSVSPLLDNIIRGTLPEENDFVKVLQAESSGDDGVGQQADIAQPGEPVDVLENSRSTTTEESSEQRLGLESDIPEPDIPEPDIPDAVDLQPQEPLEQLSLSEQYGNAGRLAELDALAQAQQFQLDQHREYVLRSRAEQSQQIDNWKTRYVGLKEQLQTARDRVAALEQKHLASQTQVIPLEAQRDAAQQLTERLQTEILDHRQQNASLEEQLDLAEVTLREQQDITAAQSRSIVAMQAELSQAQAEVAALETRLSHQGHLRQQLSVEGDRDRQERSKARDRQLQLEQETTQMTGQLLRLSEELRQTQKQSKQWRRQAQTYAEQIRNIAQWAGQAEAVPPALMALLEPLLVAPAGPLLVEDESANLGRATEAEAASTSVPATSSSTAATAAANAANAAANVNVASVSESVALDPVEESHRLSQGSPASLDLPSFPQESV